MITSQFRESFSALHVSLERWMEHFKQNDPEAKNVRLNRVRSLSFPTRHCSFLLSCRKETGSQKSDYIVVEAITLRREILDLRCHDDKGQHMLLNDVTLNNKKTTYSTIKSCSHAPVVIGNN